VLITYLQGVAARRVARREPIVTSIYPLLSDKDYCRLLTKLIGITTKNPDRAKRTRTADPCMPCRSPTLLQSGFATVFANLVAGITKLRIQD